MGRDRLLVSPHPLGTRGGKADSDAHAAVEVSDAVSELALVEQPELRPDIVRERPLAGAHENRSEKQMS